MMSSGPMPVDDAVSVGATVGEGVDAATTGVEVGTGAAVGAVVEVGTIRLTGAGAADQSQQSNAQEMGHKRSPRHTALLRRVGCSG